MHVKLTPMAGMLALLPLAVGNMGTGCSLNPFPSPNPPDNGAVLDSVDLVFVNETPLDVDVYINDAYFGTVTGNDPTPTDPVSVDCAEGDVLAFSGDLVAPNGVFPSPDNLVFNEGDQYFCGDTIEVHYFQDADGVLRVDGGAMGP